MRRWLRLSLSYPFERWAQCGSSGDGRGWCFRSALGDLRTGPPPPRVFDVGRDFGEAE